MGILKFFMSLETDSSPWLQTLAHRSPMLGYLEPRCNVHFSYGVVESNQLIGTLGKITGIRARISIRNRPNYLIVVKY